VVPESKQRRRRTWRKSLAAGLVVVLFVAVGYPCSLRIQEARDRARRAAHVTCFGTGYPGGYSYSIDGMGEPWAEVERLIAERIDDFVHRANPEQGMAVDLIITTPRLSRRMLGRLNAFPRIEGRNQIGVAIQTPEVTADGMHALADLANIDSLSLFGPGTRTKFAGEGEDLPYLTISGNDLAEVAQLTHLKYLHLWRVRVTDGGLLNLKGLTNLQALRLQDTPVTDAAVAELQRALPGLTIEK
jgi:hypothetical protein